MLTTETITFGKYKNRYLLDVLKDRNYSEWLLKQPWFQNGYEYLYNRIKEYKPQNYFIRNIQNENALEPENFLETYHYFNLYDTQEITLPLTENEKICYQYYKQIINDLKNQIYRGLENDKENPWNIKTPKNWLKNFEEKYKINRMEFKTFLLSYELPNIPYIIEKIKQIGGIEYKGAKSFLIAKERSLKQEEWWGEILKKKYGEQIGTQFKYQNCIFDFINISENIIFECKLGIKDFNEIQYRKYNIILGKYKIIYLINTDCIINIQKSKIYTTNPEYYNKYLQDILISKKNTYLDDIIKNFEIIGLPQIYDYSFS